MNVAQRQVAADPQTKPPDLGCESACMKKGCYRLQPPSQFIIITQRESWYIRPFLWISVVCIIVVSSAYGNNHAPSHIYCGKLKHGFCCIVGLGTFFSHNIKICYRHIRSVLLPISVGSSTSPEFQNLSDSDPYK